MYAIFAINLIMNLLSTFIELYGRKSNPTYTHCE